MENNTSERNSGPYLAPRTDSLDDETELNFDNDDPERLDEPFYCFDGPAYDYNRPVRITSIRYALYLTYEEVNTLIKEMEQTGSSEMVVVPFYDRDGIFDPGFYEVLVLKDFCTRHIFDHDGQYGAAKWGYDGRMFRAGLSGGEAVSLLRMMHHKLGSAIPDVMLQEEAAREKLWREHREIYFREDMQGCIRWAAERIRENAEGDRRT